MAKLIIGYYGYKNFGDDVMLRCIDDNLSGENYVLSETSNLPKIKAQTYVRKNKYLIEFIVLSLKAKTIIWGGGTCFYGGWKNQFFLVLIVFISRALGRRIIFYGVGVDSFDSINAEMIAKLAIKMIHAIYARDKKSFHYIEQLNKDTKLVADPFFAMSAKKINSNNKIVILNLTLKYITKETLGKLIQLLKINFDAIIVASLCGSDPNEDAFIDYIEEFYSEIIIQRYSSYEETVNLFQTANSYIGYRLHGMICSIATGTGFIVYGYQDKIRKAAEELGIDSARIVSNFTQINLDLLKKPESHSIYEANHQRAIDEIRKLY